MDTVIEAPYNMKEKNIPKSLPVLSHDDIRQIYTNTADIAHIKEQMGDLSEFRTSVNEVKTDMRLMNSGVNASIASLNSAFTNKLEHSEKQTKLHLKSLEGKIDENNNHFKWVRNLLISCLIVMPSTAGFGIFINNFVQQRNLSNLNKSDSLMVNKVLIEIKKELKSIKK